MILETPGSGDSPVGSDDPEGLARLWESLIAWLKKQDIFNLDRLTVWWPKVRDAGLLEPFCVTTAFQVDEQAIEMTDDGCAVTTG